MANPFARAQRGKHTAHVDFTFTFADVTTPIHKMFDFIKFTIILYTYTDF
jgi:hypothetical protein